MAVRKQLQSRRHPGEVVNNVLAACLCLLLAFGCLALGGVPTWATFVMEAAAALLFIAWAVSRIAVRRLAIATNPLLIPILLFATIVAAQLLFGWTAYWYATWQKGLLWASYGILLFVASQCFGHQTVRRWFAVGCSTFGFLVAIFSIAQAFAGNGKYYWVIPNQAVRPFFGPYANHSHYAGLMEMLLPFALVLAMARFQPLPLRVLYSFAAVIMSSTIFLAQSRGGILALAVEVGVLAILSAGGRRTHQQVLSVGVFCLFVILCLLLVRPNGLWHRFAQLRYQEDFVHEPNRLTMVKDSLKMVSQRPLLGWGFGTFPDVYPSFRSFYTDLTINAAHNDFVELAVETGLIGLALVLVFIYLLYRTAIPHVRHWLREPRDATALAALVGCTGLIIHSFSDFNLQVPANAAIFFALAAIATGRAVPAMPVARHVSGHLEDAMVVDAAEEKGSRIK